MNFNDYQSAAKSTCAIPPEFVRDKVLMSLLGIGSESGEIQEHIKHHYYHGHPFNKEHIKYEIGDCLWYLAILADCYDIKLDDVAIDNLKKLKRRYPDGFSVEKSINRNGE